MSMFEEFFDSLLPGNYALTKSMELTRINNSGTLWYTKKFLTLYYYIFLSNDIMTKKYQKEVIDIFDNYIESLPGKVKESARLFFYPENDAINFKSDKFNLFSNFASYNAFETQDERKAYYQNAKKYYFSLLMGSGGQTGIKKQLKSAIQEPGFVYSHDNIDKIILKAAIDGCMREANAEKYISDNSIKYILSEETIEKACQMASRRSVDETDIKQLNKDFPHESPKFRAIENDMIAFIRNERQILYYYGYFHSKSTGATDFEFSSLTPIGELALKANSIEFLAIWEHQKIKMISQPATADINQIPVVSNPATKFGISYTPYTDVLGHLFRQNSLSLDEYKYIVSRKKHSFNPELWIEEEQTILADLEVIKNSVHSFKRKRDIATEDGEKELKKYLLGIRSDLPVDNGTAALGTVKFANRRAVVENEEMLSLIFSVYSFLDDYKIEKNKVLFSDCENDLRRRYIATINNADDSIDGRVKIHWDLYNIHPDNYIMLWCAIVIAAISSGINDIENISKANLDVVCKYISDNFKTLFAMLGLRNLSSIKKDVQKAVNSLKNGDYSNYLLAEEYDSEVVAKYKSESSADLMAKIQEISKLATVMPSKNRERNSVLKNLLKSYYMNLYAEDNMLKCECCGQETFINDSNEPYVEFHHLIPFNIAYGPDHFLNLFALCPNCHRKIHFIKMEDKRAKYIELNDNNYMDLRFTERLNKLKEENLLRSYHLEFLLADNAITIEEYNIVAA